MAHSLQYAKDALQAQTRLSANGRIVIPAELRQALGLEPGQDLYLAVEDGALRLETHANRIRRIQKQFAKHIQPGTRVSDELIAERREEARREMEELERDVHPSRVEKAG